ncbi:hypothetical protein [Nocardioides yefusunii]|uniref:Uncharacterized protein n=1 Tax=Nocardioides yefusunii TaxID=2500546 RepID=A0ABW1QY42_9ACTN|nr:hypothetical protein [Nocardioides yefusunii]
MTSPQSARPRTDRPLLLDRRTAVRTAAWAVPAVSVAAAAPAFASSGNTVSFGVWHGSWYFPSDGVPEASFWGEIQNDSATTGTAMTVILTLPVPAGVSVTLTPVDDVPGGPGFGDGLSLYGDRTNATGRFTFLVDELPATGFAFFELVTATFSSDPRTLGPDGFEPWTVTVTIDENSLATGYSADGGPEWSFVLV